MPTIAHKWVVILVLFVNALAFTAKEKGHLIDIPLIAISFPVAKRNKRR